MAEELLGDKVEKVLKKVGADKVVKEIEKITKKPCGCGKRKARLNELHKSVRERMKKQRKSRR